MSGRDAVRRRGIPQTQCKHTFTIFQAGEAYHAQRTDDEASHYLVQARASKRIRNQAFSFSVDEDVAWNGLGVRNDARGSTARGEWECIVRFLVVVGKRWRARGVDTVAGKPHPSPAP